MSAVAEAWTRLRRGRVRLTRRGALHLLLGATLYGAGANVAAGWVIALAGVVLGAVPWALLNAVRVAGRVEVRRVMPTHATAGMPVRVRLEVRAPTAAAVIVRDDLTGTVGAAVDLRRGAALAGEVPLSRGVLHGGRVEAVVTDLFGLARAVASAEVPADCHVAPPVPSVRRVDRLAHRSGGDREAAGRGGPGPEPVGVRGYLRGDPLRAVHWRTTARFGELVVRELARPVQPHLRVVIGAASWNRAALDTAVAAVCGLAAAARAGGQPVDVAADGRLLPWNRGTRRWLASLPPHAGADGRPLAAPPEGGELEILLTPAEPTGVVVTLAADGAGEVLGVLPEDGEVGSWLSERLTGRR